MAQSQAQNCAARTAGHSHRRDGAVAAAAQIVDSCASALIPRQSLSAAVTPELGNAGRGAHCHPAHKPDSGRGDFGATGGDDDLQIAAAAPPSLLAESEPPPAARQIAAPASRPSTRLVNTLVIDSHPSHCKRRTLIADAR